MSFDPEDWIFTTFDFDPAIDTFLLHDAVPGPPPLPGILEDAQDVTLIPTDLFPDTFGTEYYTNPPPVAAPLAVEQNYNPPTTQPIAIPEIPNQADLYQDTSSTGSSVTNTSDSFNSSIRETSRSNSVDSTRSVDDDSSRRRSKSSSDVTTHARRHRRKFSLELKMQTHLTRISGACLWCWRNRKRCIKVDNGCCKYCSTVRDKIPNIPCFRSRLSSCELFRRAPTDEFCWTRRRWLKTAFDDANVWRSQPHNVVVVQEDMGGLPLGLCMKQYDPLPDDQDSYSWVDDITQRPSELRLPRYAVADIDGAQEAIERYVKNNMERYIEKKIGWHDTIPWTTFQLALKMSQTEGSTLLRNALRLWTASRIIEAPWQIAAGAETLGMAVVMDPHSPYFNKTPVTPVMDFQIDNITIHHILLPLRKRTLQDLQRKVLDNKKKSFMEIYLTMYILLHNIELTIAHDRWFAQRYSLTSRFSHYQLIQHVFLGANVMLTHFHHVTKGHVPFSLNWQQDRDRPEQVSTENNTMLTDEQSAYMTLVSAETKRQAESLRYLKLAKQYESPMFWCSQLFYDGWKPVGAPCA